MPGTSSVLWGGPFKLKQKVVGFPGAFIPLLHQETRFARLVVKIGSHCGWLFSRSRLYTAPSTVSIHSGEMLLHSYTGNVMFLFLEKAIGSPMPKEPG